MTFASAKQDALEREDRSIKGSIDNHILELCGFINSLPDYYTTSSCSGRIVLSSTPESGKKDDFKWLFVSHDSIGFYNIKNELASLPGEEVWFRFEPFIIHIVADSVDNANRLLRIARCTGIKRSGIISISDDKVVLEIIGNERIDAIIAKDGRLLVPDNYLSFLVDKANQKLDRNHETIQKLFRAVKEL